MGVAENAAVLRGWEEAGIDGIATTSPHKPIPLGKDLEASPTHVAAAVEAIRRARRAGPYGLALGPMRTRT